MRQKNTERNKIQPEVTLTSSCNIKAKTSKNNKKNTKRYKLKLHSQSLKGQDFIDKPNKTVSTENNQAKLCYLH